MQRRNMREEDRMELMRWENGDVLHRYQKALVLVLAGARRTVSTSPLHGGVREDLRYVFNYDANPGAGMAAKLEAPTYEEHLMLLATRFGLDPALTTGLSTAASMQNVALATESYQDLHVTAIVTGGIEVNGGRVGDPATWHMPQEKPLQGTINTLVHIDADLCAGVLTRALVTATEAKTAALQELMANSNYSYGIATGSGTDGTVMISDMTARYRLTNAGKHSKLGELIGRAVMRATKEALAKQSGFTPERMHAIGERLRRYRITADTLWEEYRTAGGTRAKYDFIAAWEQAERGAAFVPTVLWIHTLDEWQWGLLTEDDVRSAWEGLGMTTPLAAADDARELLLVWCRERIVRPLAADGE